MWAGENNEDSGSASGWSGPQRLHFPSIVLPHHARNLNRKGPKVVPGGSFMHPHMGFVLVLGMMVLIFLGPEWIMGFIREYRGLKKSGQQN